MPSTLNVHGKVGYHHSGAQSDETAESPSLAFEILNLGRSEKGHLENECLVWCSADALPDSASVSAKSQVRVCPIASVNADPRPWQRQLVKMQTLEMKSSS